MSAVGATFSHSSFSSSRADYNRHRGSGRPLAPATPPDMRVRIGRFRGLRTIEVEQANRSKRWKARKTGPDCSPDAKGRVGSPPYMQPVPLMDVGFAIMCSLVRHRRPQIQFLSIGSRVCFTLLSDLTSRARPLRFAITSPPSGCEDLQAIERARHTQKRGGPMGRPFPCVFAGPIRSSSSATAARRAPKSRTRGSFHTGSSARPAWTGSGRIASCRGSCPAG